MQLFNINALDCYLEGLSQCDSSILALPNNHNSKHTLSKAQISGQSLSGENQSPNISSFGVIEKGEHSSNANPTFVDNGSLPFQGKTDFCGQGFTRPLVNRRLEDSRVGLGTLQALQNFEADVKVDYKSSSYRNRKRLKGEDHYKAVTLLLLDAFYPVICKKCDKVCTKVVAGKNDRVVRCSKCHKQLSRFAHTPLHQSKLPIWMFGYAIEESFISYPDVITASKLKRKLEIGTESAQDLKRRVQLFCSQQMKAVKSLFYKELAKTFDDNFRLPKGDLTQCLLYDKIPAIDCKVIFSRTQRSLKGRKTKARGQTASIYLTESLGGKQVGTLVFTIAVKDGPAINFTVPNQTRESLEEYINELVPYGSPIFSDEAFTWLFHPNAKRVNHSAHKKYNKDDKGKRYLASNRFVTVDKVHNQVVEGFNSALETAFRSYRWFKPEYGQLYLDEFSFWKCLRYYGVEKIAEESLNLREGKGQARTLYTKASQDVNNKQEKKSIIHSSINSSDGTINAAEFLRRLNEKANRRSVSTPTVDKENNVRLAKEEAAPCPPGTAALVHPCTSLSPEISSTHDKEPTGYSEQNYTTPHRFVTDGEKKFVETAGVEPASFHALARVLHV